MTHHSHHHLPIAVPPANRFTILVVDDEPVLRAVICRILDRIGYTTVQAGRPNEVIDLLKGGVSKPDMILSDVEMPGMSGIEMVSKIRGLSCSVSELPIMLASGNPSQEMRRQAIDAGADCFMTKPFELGDLYAEVGALLRNSQNTVRNDYGRDKAGAGRIPSNRLNVDSGVKKTI